MSDGKDQKWPWRLCHWSWLCLNLDSEPRGPVALACGLSVTSHETLTSANLLKWKCLLPRLAELSGHTWL